MGIIHLNEIEQDISFSKVPEFDRDLKHLSKNYKSIYDDLERFKKILKTKVPSPPRGTVRISDLGEQIQDPVFKVQEFRCESLKGKGVRSGIRIIYSCSKDSNSVLFIEAYHKSQQSNHDKKRIIKYLNGA